MKYMLIDITTPEQTRILAIAPLKQVQLLGRLAQAEGKTVIAPPLEARGFSKLERLSLQYLLWNMLQITPSEDYPTNVRNCINAFEKIPVDPTPLADLERRCAALAPIAEEAAPSAKKPTKEVDPNHRPRANTTTGLVWEICDRLWEANSRQLPERKEIMEACAKEEINPATAGTQYAKWKASKSHAQVA